VRRDHEAELSQGVKPGSVSRFIDRHYRHFNAAVLKDAAEAYIAHLEQGGKMMITLAGAMSTAELGVSLAEMIRLDKVHAITCTGANLEEDLFNLVARSQYERIPNYRELTPEAEEDLLRRHLNRVTDTCIPEEYAIRKIEKILIEEWVVAEEKKQHLFPHEFLFKILRECRLKKFYEIDPNDSWMMAAAQKTLPIFVPG
jgi:deoxyhypusine synthase